MAQGRADQPPSGDLIHRNTGLRPSKPRHEMPLLRYPVRRGPGPTPGAPRHTWGLASQRPHTLSCCPACGPVGRFLRSRRPALGPLRRGLACRVRRRAAGPPPLRGAAPAFAPGGGPGPPLPLPPLFRSGGLCAAARLRGRSLAPSARPLPSLRCGLPRGGSPLLRLRRGPWAARGRGGFGCGPPSGLRARRLPALPPGAGGARAVCPRGAGRLLRAALPLASSGGGFLRRGLLWVRALLSLRGCSLRSLRLLASRSLAALVPLAPLRAAAPCAARACGPLWLGFAPAGAADPLRPGALPGFSPAPPRPAAPAGGSGEREACSLGGSRPRAARSPCGPFPAGRPRPHPRFRTFSKSVIDRGGGLWYYGLVRLVPPLRGLPFPGIRGAARRPLAVRQAAFFCALRPPLLLQNHPSDFPGVNRI